MDGVIYIDSRDPSSVFNALSKDDIPRVIVTVGNPVNTYEVARRRGFSWTNHIQIHVNTIDENTRERLDYVGHLLLEFLKQRSMLYPPSFRAVKRNRLSRRDLFRTPKVFLENVSLPKPGHLWGLLKSSARKTLGELYCPFSAIMPDSGINENKCTECGLCLLYTGHIVFENTILPYGPLTALLRELSILAHEKSVKPLVAYTCIHDAAKVFSLLGEWGIPVLPIPTPLWFPWYAVILHEYYKIHALVYCTLSERGEPPDLYEGLRTSFDKNEILIKVAEKTSFTNVVVDSNLLHDVITSLLSENWNTSSQSQVTEIPSPPTNLLDFRNMVVNDTRLLNIVSSLLPLFDMEFEESTCTLCNACEKACPVDALRLTQSNKGDVALEFKPAACIGCFNCVFACPENSIEAVYNANGLPDFYGDWRILARDTLVGCSSCGKPLAPSKKILRIETALIKKGFPESAVREATRLCAECKSKAFLASRFGENP